MSSNRYLVAVIKATLSCVALLTVLTNASAQTLTIEQCRQMAINGNVRIKNAELDRLSAKERQKEAAWAFMPQASITGGAFASINPMLEITLKDVLGNSDMANNLISSLEASAHSYGIDPVFRSLTRGTVAMVTVSQPLFAGGRIVNSNRLAKVGYDSAVLKQGMTNREILEEVEQAYWQTVSLEEKKTTLEQAIATVENIYATVSSAVDAGLATNADRMEVEQQISLLKSDMTRLSSGILLSKMNLCNMIGQEYVVVRGLASSDRPYLDDIHFPRIMDNLQAPETYYRDEAEICSAMEEMQLLALSEQAARLQKRIIAGQTMPHVSIGASYGYNNLINHNLFNGMVYAMVNISITGWGQNSHSIRSHSNDIKKAANEREYLSQQIMLGVRKAWMDANAAWQQIEADKQVMNTARTRLRSVEADYKAGMATMSDMLQAQTSLLQCDNTLTESKIAYIVAIRRYNNLGR